MSDTPNIYARGGALYTALAAQYGDAAATRAWQDAIAAYRNGAAIDGPWRAQETAIISGKYAVPLNESTASIFSEQILNDPLAAPAEQLNKFASNTLAAAFKNPLATLAIVAVGGAAFWFFFKRKGK